MFSISNKKLINRILTLTRTALCCVEFQWSLRHRNVEQVVAWIAKIRMRGRS